MWGLLQGVQAFVRLLLDVCRGKGGLGQLVLLLKGSQQVCYLGSSAASGSRRRLPCSCLGPLLVGQRHADQLHGSRRGRLLELAAQLLLLLLLLLCLQQQLGNAVGSRHGGPQLLRVLLLLQQLIHANSIYGCRRIHLLLRLQLLLAVGLAELAAVGAGLRAGVGTLQGRGRPLPLALHMGSGV